MANSNTMPKGVNLHRLLEGQQTSYRPQAATQTPELVTAPETPISAREVQNIVQQRGGLDQQNAAAAAALPVEGMNVNGMNSAGRGGWYSLIGPGGKISDENRAAFLAAAPGAYQNPYGDAMQRNMNALLNPEPFRYDVNADGLYQQIKDNYIKQGRQAMMDTQGQSAALTGGYGNSYGVTAGQQAYQDSLGNLANAVPQLQQMAWEQYQQGQNDRRNNLEALSKMDAQEYARWADEQEQYQKWLATLPAETRRMLGMGSGGPTIVVPNAGGGSFVYDPEQQAAMANYVAAGYITPEELKNLYEDSVRFKGVDTGNMDYYLGHLNRAGAFDAAQGYTPQTTPTQTSGDPALDHFYAINKKKE